jgi:hypothetical protein
MFGDVLVGKPPEYNGVLTNVTGIHTGDLWYLDRRFVASPGLTCLLFDIWLSKAGSFSAFSGGVADDCNPAQVAIVVLVFLLPLTLQRWVRPDALAQLDSFAAIGACSLRVDGHSQAETAV